MVSTWIETPNNAGTGPSEQWYADDTNSYNWRTIDVHRDDHRQTKGWDVNFDDGSKEMYVLDNNNADNWSWLYVHFNNSGARTDSKVMYDDGSYDLTFHDPTNQNTWDYQKQHFNAAGQMDDLFTINDDKSTEHTQFNRSNPAADWVSMTTFQDNAWHTTVESMTLRDGSQIQTDYDYNDKHSWREKESTWDSNGNLDHWTTTYDDGHQVYHQV